LAIIPCSRASAQSPVITAPVPSQIITAKKAFISNLGGGCTPFGTNINYSGGPDRAYNELYAAMKSWGKYELQTSPADADLDFEISFSCPAGPEQQLDLGRIFVDPRLSVVILDIRTHIVVWGVTEHIKPAVLQSNRDKNFELAMSRIVAALKLLAAGTALRTPAPPLIESPVVAKPIV
jgi:hypothetical protein